jgi:RNAse (barnase) inhibitor barstar
MTPHFEILSGPPLHWSSRAELRTVASAARNAGFHVFSLSAKATPTKDALLDALSEQAQFPAYFGRNWDALVDCLRDRSWCPSAGYAVTLDDADEGAFEDILMLVKILRIVTLDWRSKNIPFYVAISGSASLGRHISHEIRSEVAESIGLPSDEEDDLCLHSE